MILYTRQNAALWNFGCDRKKGNSAIILSKSLFPFLKMGTIFTSFQSPGKMPSRKNLLNNMVRGGAIWSVVLVSILSNVNLEVA